jgi:hypothetical protein
MLGVVQDCASSVALIVSLGTGTARPVLRDVRKSPIETGKVHIGKGTIMQRVRLTLLWGGSNYAHQGRSSRTAALEATLPRRMGMSEVSCAAYQQSIHLALVGGHLIFKKLLPKPHLVVAEICAQRSLDDLIDLLSVRCKLFIVTMLFAVLEDVVATDIMALFNQHLEHRDSFVQVIFVVFNWPNVFYDKVHCFFVLFANHKYALNTLKIGNASNTQSYIVNDVKKLQLDSDFFSVLGKSKFYEKWRSIIGAQNPWSRSSEKGEYKLWHITKSATGHHLG